MPVVWPADTVVKPVAVVVEVVRTPVAAPTVFAGLLYVRLANVAPEDEVVSVSRLAFGREVASSRPL